MKIIEGETRIAKRTMDREYHLRREVKQLRMKLAWFEDEEERRERRKLDGYEKKEVEDGED